MNKYSEITSEIILQFIGRNDRLISHFVSSVGDLLVIWVLTNEQRYQL